MLRWLLLRIVWLLVTLLGITFVTFVVLDRAPVDRAEIAAAKRSQDGGFVDAASRDVAVMRMRVHYGMVDPTTLETMPVWRRYVGWLENAARLRFAGPNGDHDALWHRLGAALPISALLGLLALVLAFGVGLPLGAWCGTNPGSRGDRTVAGAMFVLLGVPEFLLGLLAVLWLVGGWQWFPSSGLRSAGSDQWPAWQQIADFVWHLVLPVGVMATAPLVLVTRFVRDAVARAAAMPFVDGLRALGAEPRELRRAVLRNGLAPVATLTGGLLPMLVGGSIVVENLFALDGLGHLAFTAVLRLDQEMVMAIVVLTSVATLVSLLLSDLLHRLVDRRVRLAA